VLPTPGRTGEAGVGWRRLGEAGCAAGGTLDRLGRRHCGTKRGGGEGDDGRGSGGVEGKTVRCVCN
jgi:hypothetical protein